MGIVFHQVLLEFKWDDEPAEFSVIDFSYVTPHHAVVISQRPCFSTFVHNLFALRNTTNRAAILLFHTVSIYSWFIGSIK